MLRLSRLNFTGAAVALGTASAIEGALVVSACTGVSGMTTLICFLLLEGSALAPVATHHLRVWVDHHRRVRREREHAAELVTALGRPEYAARVMREVLRPLEIMHEDTAVLRLVPAPRDSSVYRSRSSLLEEEVTGLEVMTEMDEEFNEDFLRGYAAAALDQETRDED